MRRVVCAYAAAALTVGALDAAWLTATSGPLYHRLLGATLAPSFRLLPAALFYPVYIAGICRLAVWPSLKEGGLRRAIVDGTVLGLVAYATYDLTNQATLIHWSSWITVVDIAWGMALSAAGAAAGYLAAKSIRPRTPN